MKTSLITLLFLVVSLPLDAQDWSMGVGAGPFVFGDFLENTLQPGNEDGPEEPGTLTLSAATRAGVAVDLERSFSERFAIRLEGTFTRAPLSIRGSGDGTEFDAGTLEVSTFMVPLVFRINPRGAFRFHLHGGPALALYRVETPESSGASEPAFAGTQQEWGVAFGGGVAWWVSDRFAIEGNLTDILTSSPIDEEDLPDVPGLEVLRPHNVHTTVGVRWRF